MNPSEKFALVAETFGVEHLIQIKRGDEVLVTVGTPAGDGKINCFKVWRGVGEDENGNETTVLFEVTVTNQEIIPVQWQRVVLRAYELALNRIFYPKK